jgi:hypothetical protein
MRGTFLEVATNADNLSKRSGSSKPLDNQIKDSGKKSWWKSVLSKLPRRAHSVQAQKRDRDEIHLQRIARIDMKRKELSAEEGRIDGWNKMRQSLERQFAFQCEQHKREIREEELRE